MSPVPARIRSGFTLMELLVVIAIIALLVSILMPSLQAAKGLARMAVCQSNLHTIALANGLYMNEYNGFSVHGFEDWQSAAYSSPPSNHFTGYGLPLYPIAVFDDDYGATKAGGVGVPPGGWSLTDKIDRNQMYNGGQHFAGVGQLMGDRFLEESAGAIGCPQADFVEITPFAGGSSWGQTREQNFQHVKMIMGFPRLDPDTGPYYTTNGNGDPNDCPGAYWRNDFYQSGSSDHMWNGIRYISNYVVRGPMFRTGDILKYRSQKPQWRGEFPGDLNSKVDSEIALFADHEWADYTLYAMYTHNVLETLFGNQDPWTFFPRRHVSGPVVAYVDGHVSVFQDENRKKTWRKNAASNQAPVYGNGWAMLAHVFDSQ